MSGEVAGKHWRHPKDCDPEARLPVLELVVLLTVTVYVHYVEYSWLV